MLCASGTNFINIISVESRADLYMIEQAIVVVMLVNIGEVSMYQNLF